MTEQTLLQQLVLLRQDIDATPMMHLFDAQQRERWTARLSDLVNRRLAAMDTELVAAQASSEQRDRIVRWLRECQELLAEPTEVPELEALIAVVAAQASQHSVTITAWTCPGCGRVQPFTQELRCQYCGVDEPIAQLASPPTPEAEKQP